MSDYAAGKRWLRWPTGKDFGSRIEDEARRAGGIVGIEMDASVYCVIDNASARRIVTVAATTVARGNRPCDGKVENFDCLVRFWCEPVQQLVAS
jgi:hypothetical protein